MRILLEPGVYDMRNKGNVALLQVALNRLANLWPGARMEVITSAPHLLRLCCPDAWPLSPDLRDHWASANPVDRLVRSLPMALLRAILELRELVRHDLPIAGKVLTRAGISAPTGMRRMSANGASNGDIYSALDGADLFVATGSQYMSDACKDNALDVLDRIEAAARRGVVTAMVGQGFGPIEDPELRSKAKAILPSVDLILVRDLDASRPLLRSLGVDPFRVEFTGDDAIEPAYELRAPAPGAAIGVGLRLASYAPVSDMQVGLIRSALHDAALRHRTRLIPLPISSSVHEQDHRVLRRVAPHRWHTGLWAPRLTPPLGVIRDVGRCRLVVTGAFHPAVFALAQGIPAIGLASSAMYKGKFSSLVRQFGPSCQLVCLDDEFAGQRLTKAIDSAWQCAETVRPHLLRSAVEHIRLGRAAYSRLHDLVELKNQKIHAAAGTHAQ